MILARLLSKYKNELICDFAEYYHIYNIKDYNPRYIGILACGLRGFSRVMGEISGDKLTLDNKLNALIVDNLAWLVWSKTTDAEHNRNRPQSVYDIITGNVKDNKTDNEVKFKTYEEFENARARILEGIKT